MTGKRSDQQRQSGHSRQADPAHDGLDEKITFFYPAAPGQHSGQQGYGNQNLHHPDETAPPLAGAGQKTFSQESSPSLHDAFTTYRKKLCPHKESHPRILYPSPDIS